MGKQAYLPFDPAKAPVETLVATRDIVVVGASAGGVEALMALVGGLPAGLPASIFVVLHVPADGVSVLPRILTRSGPLTACHPIDGQSIERGRIYVAPPDHHLLLDGARIRLTRGPRENGHRPAVDPLFRSAARVFGARVIGVVLSGSGDDGTAGLGLIRRVGGVVLVQQPEEAICAGMPGSAVDVVGADSCSPVRALGPLINRLVWEEVEDVGPIDPQHGFSTQPEVREEYQLTEQGIDPPSISGFTCPECGGRLWEIHEPEMTRYRCRVGHGYSPDSLLISNTEALEGALWAALNALEEHASLTRRLARDAENRRHQLTATRFEQKAADTERQAALLRQVLEAGQKTDLDSLLANDDDPDESSNGRGGGHLPRPLPNAHGQ